MSALVSTLTVTLDAAALPDPGLLERIRDFVGDLEQLGYRLDGTIVIHMLVASAQHADMPGRPQ